MFYQSKLNSTQTSNKNYKKIMNLKVPSRFKGTVLIQHFYTQIEPVQMSNIQ